MEVKDCVCGGRPRVIAQGKACLWALECRQCQKRTVNRSHLIDAIKAWNADNNLVDETDRRIEVFEKAMKHEKYVVQVHLSDGSNVNHEYNSLKTAIAELKSLRMFLSADNVRLLKVVVDYAEEILF